MLEYPHMCFVLHTHTQKSTLPLVQNVMVKLCVLHRTCLHLYIITLHRVSVCLSVFMCLCVVRSVFCVWYGYGCSRVIFVMCVYMGWDVILMRKNLYPVQCTNTFPKKSRAFNRNCWKMNTKFGLMKIQKQTPPITYEILL